MILLCKDELLSRCKLIEAIIKMMEEVAFVESQVRVKAAVWTPGIQGSIVEGWDAAVKRCGMICSIRIGSPQ